MGSDPNSPSPSSNGKRSRDREDEVYLDNLHSHKRYLSEMMASSLNGLTVGDSLTDNLMDSPGRSESPYYFRDEMPLQQYSPMSEDSDDYRFCSETTSANNACSSSQPESIPTSPVSPYRYQRGFYCAASPTHTCIASTQLRQPRGSDSEGRFPSSPSDICHSADLRRAALLRSVQMRTQPPGPSSDELPFASGQELHAPNIETEERPCSYMKPMVEDEREYHIEDCSPMKISAPEIRSESESRADDEVKADVPRC
ncbi:unnamed protein product [Linum trigynum]|uniref:Uncharacterized protein n=2 Tax=Linum trigynum TaxID=586398 RepID=A0AAV2FLW4_9ROSI